MIYTANDLISGAYYAAGVVGREFETVSGSQISDGLIWLNDILALTATEVDMVPYECIYTFNAQVGQESYYIPGLALVDTLVFYKDNVRYSMQYEKRNAYFGKSRTNGINALPHDWYFERSFGGGNLYMYFTPDQNYEIEVHGVFRLQDVSLGQDLSLDTTTLNLGVPTVAGSGLLAAGKLVVNNIDLAGSYATIGELVNYINTGVVPNVSANLDVNNLKLVSMATDSNPTFIRATSTATSPKITSKGVTNVATLSDLGAVYANGTLGVGATLTNSGAMVSLVIDGVAMAFNDRVLVKDQTNGFENGIYTVSVVGDGFTNWELTRALNYDQVGDMQPGNLVNVLSGTTNADTYWTQDNTITTVGVTNLVFTSYNNISFSNFSTDGNAQNKAVRSSGIDQFYRAYLRYALAERICAEYNFDVPPNIQKQLANYKGEISKQSRPLDLRNTKVSILQGGSDLNYAQVNIGRGYTTNQ